MSDRMTPISFANLMNWIITEKKEKGTVFGVKKPYIADSSKNRVIFGRKLETPIGPAAGPHTQLAQNIIAAYYAGSRFFELKTVQILDGEDLPVNKPCIKADDECYNVEWSTELYVPQAMEEYIKAWFACSVMAKEFGLGDMDGFQFNMSVGYDLEGIKSEKINTFIDTMMEAKDSNIFKECKAYLLEHIDDFEKVTAQDIESISSNICNSATISTLHGCPPQEIERIAKHLIEEKGLHTFIKCNPTLLGYEFARKTMDEMGYDYIVFGDFHFKDDLQYEDAVPMLTRLMELCKEKNLEFGVKITNTFPVDVKQNELPGEEMYMSGKSLYPLSISLAAKLTKEFNGKLRISYSGGADFFNIAPIVEAGVWPVTMATTMLKLGGYQRLKQISELLDKSEEAEFLGVNVEKIAAVAKAAITDEHHIKAAKPLPSRKSNKKVPLVDCFIAPCKEEGCPIHQDICTYMQLVGEGKYLEALRVITQKNPLPFITGTICAHNCMSKCNRNFYESPVQIRSMKHIAAQKAYDELLKELKPSTDKVEGKVAVIGGGPAGLSAAFFLARGGMDVTIFEKTAALGGVVKNIIPEFRIPSEDIAKDAKLVEVMGAKIVPNTEIKDIDKLKEEGFTHIILAVGASKPSHLSLESGETKNALQFLAEMKANEELHLGKNVVVIGGGNTAMDTARAAKRADGVENVYLVYRRTKRYMPADEEELQLAIKDGVEFKELLAPVKIENGELVCKVMKLSDIDASGRRGVVETGEITKVPADTVLTATGEKVPTDLYKANGIEVTDRGLAIVDANTLESSKKQVYVIGDGLGGPATVVEGIRDAMKASESILGKAVAKDIDNELSDETIYERKAILKETIQKEEESQRCLNCHIVCENCVEVCPNRANISITVPEMKMHQIIHVDYMCNECGNCNSFCPYAGAPYQDKFTLFANEKDFADSKNEGFLVLDKEEVRCKIRLAGEVFECKVDDNNGRLSEGLAKVIQTVCKDYSYLL
ncbi:MAG: putative selenate reductase subunit YgfK [Lachnospiraceae bacterium]